MLSTFNLLPLVCHKTLLRAPLVSPGKHVVLHISGGGRDAAPRPLLPYRAVRLTAPPLPSVCSFKKYGGLSDRGERLSFREHSPLLTKRKNVAFALLIKGSEHANAGPSCVPRAFTFGVDDTRRPHTT